MDEKNNVTKSHKVLLANRKNGAFSGVVDVLSFDVAEILLETELENVTKQTESLLGRLFK